MRPPKSRDPEAATGASGSEIADIELTSLSAAGSVAAASPDDAATERDATAASPYYDAADRLSEEQQKMRYTAFLMQVVKICYDHSGLLACSKMPELVGDNVLDHACNNPDSRTAQVYKILKEHSINNMSDLGPKTIATLFTLGAMNDDAEMAREALWEVTKHSWVFSSFQLSIFKEGPYKKRFLDELSLAANKAVL